MLKTLQYQFPYPAFFPCIWVILFCTFSCLIIFIDNWIFSIIYCNYSEYWSFWGVWYCCCLLSYIFPCQKIGWTNSLKSVSLIVCSFCVPAQFFSWSYVLAYWSGIHFCVNIETCWSKGVPKPLWPAKLLPFIIGCVYSSEAAITVQEVYVFGPCSIRDY